MLLTFLARTPRRMGAVLCVVGIAVCLLLSTPVASAHPLGNFSVNRYSRLVLESGQVRVLYVLDMAEIPAFQERQRIDADSNDVVSSDEEARWVAEQSEQLRRNLHLLINGQPVPLQQEEQEFETPPGQGGLPTLRLTVQYVAAVPANATLWDAQFRDDNFAGRLGWREIVVQPAPGTELLDATVPMQDRSQELRSYPEDLLENPLAVSSASFRWQPGVTTAAEGTSVSAPESAGARTPDRFAALMTSAVQDESGRWLLLVAAFGLGALHALSPGHGKTIVAAYLVGSRGTARHALFLGLTTTVTHTAGVFALGFITLFVSQFILPEQLYPWLSVLSGLIVVAIGLGLFSGRLRMLTGRRRRATAVDEIQADAAGYLHTHDDGSEAHSHGWLGTSHSHAPPQYGTGVTWRNLLALGVSGGLLPCPSAIVVLLSAIALHQVGVGLLLIVAFSVGLASVLTVIGIVLVYAGRLFARLPLQGRLIQFLPIVSALLIALAGAGITVRALTEIGLLSL